MRHISPGIFSGPVLMGNQGSTHTAAGDVTADDAEFPSMARSSVDVSRGRGPRFAAIA
jgi:hypothetical protein